MGEPSFEKSSISSKFPSYREQSSKSIYQWLRGKRIDDNAEGLWRVHDKLYDLVNFIQRHPGGADWLELTQGTDITELFETHHITEKAEMLLHSFYVCEAKKPRNYRITFCDDGFYKTLKIKVANQLKTLNREKLESSKLISDALLVGTIFTAIAAVNFNSVFLAVFSGVFLAMFTIMSLSFLHQKDNWRMFLFNLSGFNYREWRLSHVMSHHMYSNTLHDFELFQYEPYVQWMPMKKGWSERYSSVCIVPFVWLLNANVAVIRRTIGYFDKRCEFRWDHLITFFLPITMALFREPRFVLAVRLWLVIISVSSFLVGLNESISGRHHTKIYHEGDELPRSMDFGIIQMKANIDRCDIDAIKFLKLAQFGQNILHHMFPTLDHNLLLQLQPAIIETCREFNVQLRVMPWSELTLGYFNQLQRTDTISLKAMKV